jgi:hypothetical protein
MAVFMAVLQKRREYRRLSACAQCEDREIKSIQNYDDAAARGAN